MDYLTEQARLREEVVQASKVFLLLRSQSVTIYNHNPQSGRPITIRHNPQSQSTIWSSDHYLISKARKVQPPDYLSIADSGLPSYEAAIRLPLSPRILLESSNNTHICNLPGGPNVILYMGGILPAWCFFPESILWSALHYPKNWISIPCTTLPQMFSPGSATNAPDISFDIPTLPPVYSTDTRFLLHQIFITIPTNCFAATSFSGFQRQTIILDFPLQIKTLLSNPLSQNRALPTAASNIGRKEVQMSKI